MNNDLISRSALKEATQKLYEETLDGIVKFGIKKTYDLIDNAPTVGYQGEWVFKDLHNGKTWYECSVCGRKIHVGDKVQLSDYPFCHCGADMRGEEE